MTLAGDSNLDLSVSQVNGQIGTLMRRDLGLGLLFVTGEARNVTLGPGQRLAGFTLYDGECELRADLAPSLRNPPAIRAGQQVRVTAWLGFYYPSRFRLIVRDIEILDFATLPAPVAAPVEAAPNFEADAQAAADAGIAPGIIPPWLEEIRKRQFSASGQPERPATAAALQEGLTIPARPVRPEPEEPAATPTGDAELQMWLAQLFDASESEDIELTRSESEIVAVRSEGADHFRRWARPASRANSARIRAVSAAAAGPLRNCCAGAGAPRAEQNACRASRPARA
jgi:hypothetical protein